MTRSTAPRPTRILFLVPLVAGLLILTGLLDASPAVARVPTPGDTGVLVGAVNPSIAFTPDPARQRRRSRVGSLSRTPVDTIGVVSMNAFQDLRPAQARQDALDLTRRSDVDLIGWQEAAGRIRVYRALARHGWSTQVFRNAGGEDAVSWRDATFTFSSSQVMRMHDGLGEGLTAHPFPSRWVTRVSLVDRASGHETTLLNTHVNQHIEVRTDDGFGGWTAGDNARLARRHLATMAPMWRGVTGRYVLGTGDYNFDYRADRRLRPAGGIADRFDAEAVSSYRALGGVAGLPTTHPPTHRYIDYVFSARATLNAGYTRFLDQRVLTGYHSDHRPLLVRLALY